jgi:hypothetical protein
MRTPALRVALAGLFVLGGIAIACSGAKSSTPGDDVVDDTRPSEPRAPADPDDSAAPPDTDDGAIPYADGGGNLSLGACDTCSCTGDHFCYGGGGIRAIRTTAAADAGAGEAGLAACPIVGDGSVPAVGCNPFPAGCTDCSCIIAALQPKVACYLVCGAGDPPLVYCPSP